MTQTSRATFASKIRFRKINGDVLCRAPSSTTNSRKEEQTRGRSSARRLFPASGTVPSVKELDEIIKSDLRSAPKCRASCVVPRDRPKDDSVPRAAQLRRLSRESPAESRKRRIISTVVAAARSREFRFHVAYDFSACLSRWRAKVNHRPRPRLSRAGSEIFQRDFLSPAQCQGGAARLWKFEQNHRPARPTGISL